jgi:hypothetical protein
VSLLTLNIVQFLEDSQPGFVACEFIDADGRLHTIIDKVPMFTNGSLDSTSPYPHIGAARCEVLECFQDQAERTLVRITLDRPDGIESTSGISEFLVLKSQVS